MIAARLFRYVTLSCVASGLTGCATAPMSARLNAPSVSTPYVYPALPATSSSQRAPSAPVPSTAPRSPAVFEPGSGASRARAGAARVLTPLQALAAANAEARQKPSPESFVEARQVYAFTPGALFELHASPGFVTTVLLEPGERLSDVAAGDTARWMVTEAETETESEGRAVVLVKPAATGLRTNLVLITDRRTYLIDAFSHAGETYAAQISWTYPPRAPEAARGEAHSYAYRVRTARGKTPRWLPLRVFDDGRRTWIVFRNDIATADMPPLFVLTPEGAELVNYRVDGAQLVVDRLFDVAELRLGARRPVVVRIERNARRQVLGARGAG